MMSSRKDSQKSQEISLFDEAILYKRGEYWHFRMWLKNENKYARKSLRTRSEATAREKGKDAYLEIMANQKMGKTYFSLTTKEGVQRYLDSRQKDVESGLIVPERLGTIRTHLQHWLAFIGKDTKLKELERTDCEHYFHERTKTKKKLEISQITLQNEQSTINAMMRWLFKHHEVRIEAFDFKKLPRIDHGDNSLRRSLFDADEITQLTEVLWQGIDEGQTHLDDNDNLVKVITSYYLLISMITGLRRGEQLKLRWSDIQWLEHHAGSEGQCHSLVQITVRGETSKVRKTRTFIVKDSEYFENLFKLLHPRFVASHPQKKERQMFAQTLIFSVDGHQPITARAISYHFNRIMERANIKVGTRDLVPYSFRHYFITQRINSGLSPTAVAEMAGTSITQIERTYYHTTREKMITNALADYYVEDGIIKPLL